MTEINRFKDEALRRNLCQDFRSQWENMKTKDDLLKFSLDPKSISYVALSTYEGWGLSTGYIRREFSKHINGHANDNNNASLYCRAEGQHTIKHTENNIMDTAGCFFVPIAKCPILHVNNNSDIDLKCEGMNIVKLYMYDESKVNIIIDHTCKIFVMQLSDKASVSCNIPELMKVRHGDVRHYAYGEGNY